MSNLLSPWRHPLRLVRMAGYILTALAFGAFTFATTIALLAVTAGLLVTFVLALPFAWAMFVWPRGLAHAERSRIAALMDVEIADPVPFLTRTGWLRRLYERARCVPRWKEIAHHLARLPVAGAGFALTAAAWCGSLAMILMPAYVDALPGDSAKFYFFELTSGPGAWLACVAGVLGIVIVAPWVTIGVALTELALGRALLGPTAEQTHAAQVSKLETSRTLTDLGGPIIATTDNGRIEATSLRAPTMRADSDNGRVTLEFAAAPMTVEATTDNGPVEVVVPNTGEAYRLSIDTDNGRREQSVRVDPASDRSLTLRTNNGSVTARTAP